MECHGLGSKKDRNIHIVLFHIMGTIFPCRKTRRICFRFGKRICFATELSAFTFVKWLVIKRRKKLAASFNMFLDFESYQLEGTNPFCENFALLLNKFIIQSLINCRHFSSEQLQTKTDTN